jgi:hypothetical protein
MRSSIVIAGAAALVAAMLLGGWFLLGHRGPEDTTTGSPQPAPLTTLERPPGSSTSSRRDPYPTVPSTQVQADDGHDPRMQTGKDGRQLLIPVYETDCSLEEVRLLAERHDRVELEIRTIVKPVPPGASIAADGSYGCMSYLPLNGPHAAVELRAPLGNRTVIIDRERW